MSAPIGYSAPPLVPVGGVPEEDADIFALIEEEQKRQEEERQRLQQQAQGQQQAATGLRRLGLITGMGTNPLLQGFSAKALGQAGALDANAADTVSRANRTAVDRMRTLGRVKPQLSTDPMSPASKAAQARVKAIIPTISDADLGTVTEASAEAFLKYRSMTEQRGVTTTGQQLGAEQRMLDREQRGAQFSQMMGFRWAELSQEQKLAMLRLMDAQAARDDKKTTTLAERNVGGWEFDPANPPSADAAKKMADASIARDEIEASLTNLERMYQESGSEVIGARAGEMESEWINITNRLRTLNEMGVPNGADYLMLAKQIEDPTELRNVITSKGRGLAKMKTLRDQVRRRVAATAKALKYSPAGSGGLRRPGKAGPKQPPGAQATPDLDLDIPVPTPGVSRTPVRETLSKDRKWKRLEYADGMTETVPNG